MSEQHEGKKWKPGSNHPWRFKNTYTPKAAKAAKEKSEISSLNNYLKGGGKPGR